MKAFFTIGYRLVLCLFIVTLAACSHSVNFIPSSVVPGADGKVRVNKDNNGNYAVDVTVYNLADPSRLQTPKANYIVWMETPNNGAQNLGRLVTSHGPFSKAMKGTLVTVTPYTPVRFLITAEDQTDPAYPGTAVVLTSESNIVRDRN